jgi:hypothetical protein
MYEVKERAVFVIFIKSIEVQVTQKTGTFEKPNKN